jgi:hypothetical protein
MPSHSQHYIIDTLKNINTDTVVQIGIGIRDLGYFFHKHSPFCLLPNMLSSPKMQSNSSSRSEIAKRDMCVDLDSLRGQCFEA